MPRTTDLRQYPPEFEHLLLKSATGLVEFSFPTSARALRFRHRFYAYMKLLRDNPNLRPDLVAAAKAVGIRMSDDRCILRIAPEHDSWEGELIRSVLQFEKGAPTEAVVLQQRAAGEAQAALKAKLAEIRAKNSSQ